jgi:hypothetical protein
MQGGSGEPVIPWGITLNAAEEISGLIKTKGFNSSGGTTNFDMIRVWVEVLVFNGQGAPIRSSNYLDNLGTGGFDQAANGSLYGTSLAPKAYIKAFYIKEGAPEITHPNVGDWNSGTLVWNQENASNPGGGGYKGAGTEMRRDKFALKAILDPNPKGAPGTGLGEVTFRTKLDGGSWSAWSQLWTKGPPTTGLPVNNNGAYVRVRDTAGPRIRYDFEYWIDSKALADAADYAAIKDNMGQYKNWSTAGGTISLEVRIKDDASPPNEDSRVIVVSVDNFAPVADENHMTNKKVAGSNVDFMGRVYDYADHPVPPITDVMNSEYTPRKLSKVYAWFTKKDVNGQPQYVNINNGDVAGQPGVTAPATRTLTNVFSGRKADVVYNPTTDTTSDYITSLTLTARGTQGSVNIPQMANGETGYNAAWVREINTETARPGNKMLWAPVNSKEYDIRWSFTVDSTKLPDGYLTLHYIAVDEAGNASYYKQEDISVRNKYPQIYRVKLYTNNTGMGAAYTQDAEQDYVLNKYRGQMFNNLAGQPNQLGINTTGYLNSGFISKNKYLGFEVETYKGNRDLHFRVQHVKRELITIVDDPTASNPNSLQALFAARNNANNINLYTIAFHGDYSSANWKALGVMEDNPSIGTHFVLKFKDDKIPDEFKYSNTAKVWKYTVLNTTPVADYTPTGQDNTPPVPAPVVFGPVAAFDFDDLSGSNGGPSTGEFNGIGEFYGSHPGYLENPRTDSTPDNPDNTAFFLIRVWDSITPASSLEYGGDLVKWENDQLYDAVVIGMNVYQSDKNAPIARLYDLNPYTEAAVTINNLDRTISNAADPQFIGSNIVRGGLYNAKTPQDMVRSGFIEPRGGSKFLNPVNSNGVTLPDYPLKEDTDEVPAGTANDHVSGTVIQRGWARDDQLIDEIRIKIGNDSEKAILKLNTTAPANDPKLGTMEAVGTNKAFVVEELHWKSGHTVEWAYVWDTQKEPASLNAGPSLTPVSVQVTVKDAKSSPGTSQSVSVGAESGTTYHNQINVDIVPYITGFERASRFSTKRSLQGWYSFYRKETGSTLPGEDGIRVRGYNFGTGSTSITVNGTGMSNISGNTGTERTFEIPAGATSGAILMTTSGVAAYNNTSVTKGKSWNSEFSAYTSGSDLWMNRPHAHIWQSQPVAGTNTTAGTYFAADKASADLSSPSMALQYNGSQAGRLHGVWAIFGRDSFYYGQNQSALPQGGRGTQPAKFSVPGAWLLTRAGEPYAPVAMDYYNYGDDNYILNVSSIAAYQRDGEPRINLKPTVYAEVWNNNNANEDGGGADRGFVIALGQAPTPTTRWESLHIKKTDRNNNDDNPGRVFVTAYDSDIAYKRLFFTVQANKTMVRPDNNGYGGDNGNQMFLDGASGITAGINNNNGWGNIGVATGGAGKWSALDYDSNGYPVIAYFDEQNQTLRLAYANSNNPTQGNNWTRRYVLAENDVLRTGSGSHVSMKIDRARSDTIHLAFYNDGSQRLVYASGTRTGDFTAVVVDKVVNGGKLTDISVDRDGNPWIVYTDNNRKNSRDGARMAYRQTNYPATSMFNRPLTDTITGRSIQGWEAMTMPSDFSVLEGDLTKSGENRLNIAVWPPTGAANSAPAASPIGAWHAAVGYASDQFRIGYFVKPANIPTGL